MRATRNLARPERMSDEVIGPSSSTAVAEPDGGIPHVEQPKSWLAV
jgi:hypothetical protein